MNYFINYESFNEYNENMANALVTESAMNFYNILGGNETIIGLESFSNITSNNDPVLEGLKDNIALMGNNIKNAVSKGWKTITEKWNAFVSWLKNLIKKKPKVTGKEANIFVRAWNKILQIVTSTIDKIASLFSNKSNIADESFINLDFALEKSLISNPPNKAMELVEGGKKEINNVVKSIQKIFGNLIDSNKRNKKDQNIESDNTELKIDNTDIINKDIPDEKNNTNDDVIDIGDAYDKYMEERQDIEAEANADNIVNTEKIVKATVISGDKVLTETKDVLYKSKNPAMIAIIVALIIAAIAGGIGIFKFLSSRK